MLHWTLQCIVYLKILIWTGCNLVVFTHYWNNKGCMLGYLLTHLLT